MQHSLSLVAVLVISLTFACRIEHKVQYDGLTAALPDSTVERVDYGFSGETVYFAVFQTAHQQLTGCVNLTMTTLPSGSNICWGYINLPDGTRQDLPTSSRIYESSTNHFKSAKIFFTTSQLREYLNSGPQPATIDGLNQLVLKNKS
jgi:hypothetical protein